MGRISKFFKGTRRPQVKVVDVGQAIFVNGRVFIVWQDHIQLLPVIKGEKKDGR